MPRASTLQSARIALPEPRSAARAFDAAAQSFDAACAAHDHARAVLLERLAWLPSAPELIVDAGCATGRGLRELAGRFGQAAICGVDASSAMLKLAARRWPAAQLLLGRMEALPFASGSVDLLFANLVLPWCDPATALRECARVLAPGGLLLASTTGPATLGALRRAWRTVDDDVHVHASLDMQTLGDVAVQAGLHEPVLDIDRVTLRYSSVQRLHAEIRAVGAVNSAPGRRATLTGKGRLRRYQSALLADAGHADGLDVVLELIFLQTWGRPAGAREEPPEPRFHGIAVRRE